MLAVEGLLPGSGPRKSCEVGKTIEEEIPENKCALRTRSGSWPSHPEKY